MTDSVADRLAIHEVVALHGHLSDSGEFDRWTEVFTEDVAYDLTAFGAGTVPGVEALRDMARELGDANPLAHHVTNVVVTALDGDTAHAISKGLAVNTDATTTSVTYEDTLRRTPHGWRIAHRRVIPRQKPLTP
ncbi:nuclear transport factor 2 family protein [Nocardia sp. NPDC056611]|uniref:nuclear transport factor 2 family protein n=1 Tax=Nocardia sp. NPDC056611 TaxID=3345877 RepID=UPI00366C0DC3